MTRTPASVAAPSTRRFADPVDRARGWRFICRSGRVSLDLLATLTGVGARDTERLSCPDLAQEWCVRSGLVERTAPRFADDDVRALQELREAIYLCAAEATAGRAGPASAIRIINHAARHPVRPVLLDESSRAVVADPATAVEALSLVARDAVDLLGGSHRDRIRECEHEDCTVLFLDTSRAGTRRWCSMSPCGDKINARKYRERHSHESTTHPRR